MNECMNNKMNGGISSCSLRDRIKAYDFAMHEMHLYLDVNPKDTDAIELFYAYRRKKKELVAVYEKHFGPYVVKVEDAEGDRWYWADDPWPWEYTGKE